MQADEQNRWMGFFDDLNKRLLEVNKRLNQSLNNEILNCVKTDLSFILGMCEGARSFLNYTSKECLDSLKDSGRFLANCSKCGTVIGVPMSEFVCCPNCGGKVFADIPKDI